MTMLSGTSLTEQLVSALLAKPIEQHDRLRACYHLLDWLGCVAAGSPSEVAGIYRSLLASESGSSTALWQGQSSFDTALAYNAALGNVLEMDDVHRRSILHPGPVVIPAALAVAEQQSASLEQLLDAIIIGYEVTIRIGSAIGRSHYRFFHNTSSCGAFGAAMAAGLLWQLTPAQLVAALGNAGSRTGGLWQMRHEGVHTKQWHNAEAAKSGVAASRLAKSGMTGPVAILEGPQGLFAAMSDDAVPERVLDDQPHWLLHDCTFKPWPACRHAHPALDVVSSVLAEHAVTTAEVQHILIETYQDALTFCDKPMPVTAAEARFSIQHAVAARMIWGEPELWHYQPAHLAEPAVAALRQRIRLQVADDLEQGYPMHFGARCQLTLIDGRTLTYQLDDTLGDPERPLSTEQLVAKARRLFAVAGLSKSCIDDLTSLGWAKTSELSTVFGLLQQEPCHD